ncbi:hypothetical protein OA92_21285 [Marinomonas sp. SBI22]|uniref:hypothetical protein n=1 Tax=unclassified Marinomonas TaxID=196814 RepID=UPI0007AF4E9E|nr:MULTISPECIES: hypothetical protein [unclassified Marinomonas]KZM39130.1 hypothetical protein OA92_21285 [Marinomonas sp. SBI22]KZM39914.1 hypothetical protein OA91_21140 [Marinomonas sp. SBI8L]
MYELRILSGLKNGISFSLNEEPLYIGSSDENDILMLDRSFLGAAFSVRETDNGKVEVFFTSGDFKSKNGEPLRDTCLLEPQDLFCHKDIWLQIADKETPWLDDVPTLRPVPKVKVARTRKKTPTVIIGCVCSALVFGIYNLSYANQSDVNQDNTNLPNEISNASLYASSASQTSLPIQHKEATIKVKPALSSAQVELNYLKQIEDMLDERELDGVKLAEQNNQIVLEGSVSKRDKAVLARMLMRYEFEHPNAPIVKDNTNEHGDSFSIKVAAVVSGPYGHLLLEDGTRLYKGQTYMDYRLVAIRSDVIEFQGEKKVAVRW